MAKAKRPAQAKLSTLAKEINKAHYDAVSYACTAITKAIEVGRLLTEARAKVDHGGWATWVKENCRFGDRQARKYLRAYENRDAIEAAIQGQIGTPGSDLTINEALALIADPAPRKAPEMEAHEACSMVPDMTPEEFERLCCSIVDGGGLLCPIVLYEGKILDGRQRYRACLHVGVEPTFVEVERTGRWAELPDDEFILEYIEFANVARGHHTAEDRARISRVVGEHLADEAAGVEFTDADAKLFVDSIRRFGVEADGEWELLIGETIRRRGRGEAAELSAWMENFDGPMREALAWAAEEPAERSSVTHASRVHPAAFGLASRDVAFVGEAAA